MPLYPPWSGAMLEHRQKNNGRKDSNALIEQVFSTIKHEVIKEKNIRPAKACLLLYKCTMGELKELEYKTMLTKTNKRKCASEQDDLTQEEEFWKRKGKNDYTPKKKKSRYFESPHENLRSVNLKYKGNDFFDEANAMPWGGMTSDGHGSHFKQKLVNTCTIDNILMALYMILECRPDIKAELSTIDDTVWQTVLELATNDMKAHNWASAKAKFLTDIRQNNSKLVDCYDTEFNAIVKYLLAHQEHNKISICTECKRKKEVKCDIVELR